MRWFPDPRLLSVRFFANLRLALTVAVVVLVLDQACRLVTVALLSGQWVALPGDLVALTRSDDAIGKSVLGLRPSLGLSLLGLDGFILLVLLSGPFGPLGRIVAALAGAVLGGVAGNLASLAFAGQVSNWLALRQAGGWMVWSTGDLFQLAGYAALAALAVFALTTTVGGLDTARIGRRRA